MSDDNNAQSSKQAESGEAGKELVVNRTPEEYAQRLKEVSAEAKKYRQELSDYKEKLAGLEKAEMEKAGELTKLVEKLKKELDDTKGEVKKTKGNYAMKVIEGAIKAEANKLGCLDSDAIMKLADLSSLEVDEDFNIAQESLKVIMDDLVKNKPYLFEKKKSNVKDQVPFNQVSPSNRKPTIDELAKTVAALSFNK